MDEFFMSSQKSGTRTEAGPGQRGAEGGQASRLLLLLFSPRSGKASCGSEGPERVGSMLCPSVCPG